MSAVRLLPNTHKALDLTVVLHKLYIYSVHAPDRSTSDMEAEEEV